MLHGKVKDFFQLSESVWGTIVNNHPDLKVAVLCDQNYSPEQLREDLTQTLKEEVISDNGISSRPGSYINKFELTFDYQCSTFLGEIKELVRELGRDQILNSLIDAYNQEPSNQILVHNLHRVFDLVQANKDGYFIKPECAEKIAHPEEFLTIQKSLFR